MSSFASVVNLPSFHSISIKLDRTNYAFWRAQILATTPAHNFDDLLDKYITPPSKFLPSSSGDCITNPDFLIWIRRDQYLVSWLLSSIGESMLGHVTRCVTSRDIWSVLESLFQSQSKARIMQLQLQLQTQKKGDLSVDDYVLKMRGSAAGKLISDDDLITHILAGFGVEFEAVVVNLTHRSDSLNLQEVQFALQAQEIRLQQQSSLLYPSANVAYQQNGGRGYFHDNYNNNGGRSVGFRGRRGGRSFGGRSNFRDKMICQLCGKPGHVALKCFRRFDVHFTGANSPSPQAYLSDMSTMEYGQEDYYHEPQYDSSWYVDSGATNHITNDMNNMQLSAPYTGSEQVAVGNSNQLPIQSIGKSFFPSFQPSTSLLLHNILYVPQITKNLISISQFTKDNKVMLNFTKIFVWLRTKPLTKY